MVYHPNKNDLARLKKSKPIPIVAHTGEAVIPVVYTDLVNKFLDKQGIHLPLTHHKLAEFKAEAGVSGYAVGTGDLKKKKKKKKKGKIYKDKSVNITINVGAGGGGAGGKGGKGGGFGRGRGGGGGNFRGFRFNPAPPYDPTKQTDTTAKIITDYTKLLEEQKRAEEKNKALSTVSVASAEAVQDKLPIHFSTKSVPLRPNSFDSLVTIEQEEAKYSIPSFSGNTNTGSSSSSNLGGFFDDIINVPQFNIELPPEEPEKTKEPSTFFEKFKKNVAGEELMKFGDKEYTIEEWNVRRKEKTKKNKERRQQQQRVREEKEEKEEKLPPTAPPSPTAKYSLKNEFFNEREIPSNPNPSSLLAKPPNYLKPTVSSLKAKEPIEEKKEPVNKKQLIEELKEANKEKQKPSKVRFTPPFQMVMRVTEDMGEWLKRRREKAKELGKEKEEAEFQSNPKFARKHWNKLKEDIVWSNR